MTKTITLALVALLVASTTPAAARHPNCAPSYKDFVAKMTKLVDGVSGEKLAEAYRKSLAVYDSCPGGDDFTTHGVWDKIIADTEASMTK